MTRNMNNFSDQMLLVGCGNMAGAILNRWLGEGLAPSQVAVVDPLQPALPQGVRVFADIGDWHAALGKAEWVILGVKPQQWGDVSQAVSSYVGAETTVISILAGVCLVDLEENFPNAAGYVRVLPSLAARIGVGTIIVASSQLDEVQSEKLQHLLSALGDVVQMDDDLRMDLVTAYVGSGPAFVVRLLEAYAAAGERLGFTAHEARVFALATFDSTTALLKESGEAPSELIAKVANKGGTTQAGLDILDADGRLVTLMTQVLRAARDHGRELANMARRQRIPAVKNSSGKELQQ